MKGLRLRGTEVAASFLKTWDAKLLTKDKITALSDEVHFSEIEAMANGEEGRPDMCGFDGFDLGSIGCYPTAIMIRKEDVLNWDVYYTFRLLEERNRNIGGS